MINTYSLLLPLFNPDIPPNIKPPGPAKALPTIPRRTGLFFFSNKLNESVIKRHNTSDNFIKLNSINYDKLITSHIVGIVSTMDKRSKFGIVDIDSPKIDEISSSSEFNEIKQATQKVFDYFSKFNKCQIYYTGKNGFHVYVYFDRSMSPDQIKSYLMFLINFYISN